MLPAGSGQSQGSQSSCWPGTRWAESLLKVTTPASALIEARQLLPTGLSEGMPGARRASACTLVESRSKRKRPQE